MNFSFQVVDDTDEFAFVAKCKGPRTTSFGYNPRLEDGSTVLDKVKDHNTALTLLFPTIVARLDNEDTPTHLHVLKGLGEGSMGRVFLTRDARTSKVFALKVFNKCLVFACEEQENTVTERNCLADTHDNPFTTHLRASFQDEARLYMLLDYCAGGDLATELMRWPRGMPMEVVTYNAAHLLEGIASLHALGIIHRDLKPRNILLTMRGHIKISDFGSAIRVPPSETESWVEPSAQFGTMGYFPPEVFDGRHNCYIDWWCLGVIIYEMVLGKHPFLSDTTYGSPVDSEELSESICDGEYSLPETLDYSTRRIIRGLLRLNPDRRFGAPEARDSTFFAGWDWDLVRRLMYEPPHSLVVRPQDATSNSDRKFIDTSFEDNETIENQFVDESIFASFERSPAVFVGTNYLRPKLSASLSSGPLDLSSLKTALQHHHAFSNLIKC